MKRGRVVSRKHLSTLLEIHGALPKIHHGAPALCKHLSGYVGLHGYFQRMNEIS